MSISEFIIATFVTITLSSYAIASWHTHWQRFECDQLLQSIKHQIQLTREIAIVGDVEQTYTPATAPTGFVIHTNTFSSDQKFHFWPSGQSTSGNIMLTTPQQQHWKLIISNTGRVREEGPSQ